MTPRARSSGWHVLLGSALVLASCTGLIGNDGDGRDQGPSGTEPPGTTTASFTCDPSQVPTELPLRRLSRVQSMNTLRDVVRELAPAHAAAILTETSAALARVPQDSRVNPSGDKHGGFRRLDQTVQQDFVDAGYEAAVAIGKALTASTDRVAALAGAGATDDDPRPGATNDAACLDDAIRRIGAIVHRRALDDGEVALYRETAGADRVAPAALADVVAHMLAGPYFVYHVEHGGAATSGATYALSGIELANRLSYHFWQSMPDAELRAAALAGELETDAGYRAQVERLFADPRTLEALDAFVMEWLWLDDLPAMDGRVGDPVYDAFANGFVPTAQTNEHLVDDVLQAVRHVVRSGGSFADFLGENRSFARHEDVAAIYGVSPWKPGSEPVAVGPERVGLLTRPALLATGSANTRPIMKGVFIRTALLCDEIPPPPNNAANTPLVLSPTMTTREVVEQITEKAGTACAGCHKSLINPLGFASENFDALGRHREAQVLLDEEGRKLGEKAVDTTSIPRVNGTTDLRASTGAGDLTKLLIESGRVQACFARQYFRYTFQRAEDTTKDGCVLAEVSEAARGSSSMAEILMKVAMHPSFRRRTIQ